LQIYLAESLRTWNALAAYWRGDFLWQSVPGQQFYDLTSVVDMPNTLRPLTVTDVDIYVEIQYHLLEPAVGVNPWSGVSKQFTADDLIAAVQRRRDEVLSVCGCTITRSTVPAVLGRILLPDNVIDIRRVAYLPAVGLPSVLWPDDTWAEQSFEALYTLDPAGTPTIYRTSTQPPISFDVNAPPGAAGSYELLTVNAGPPLVPTAAQTLAIPDDWTHVIKWGALADLLSRESNAKDIPRAAYCEQRYRMGLQLLTAAPALLALRSNNVTLQIDSVRAADLYRTSWQADAAGPPAEALQSGLNLVVLAPTPDSPAVPYSLTTTVVENAPIPVLPTDPVQVAREDLDAILDCSQHLASFKMGGAEFAATMPLFQRFLKQAALYNTKLAEFGEFTQALYGTSQLEESANPRTTPVEAGA